MSLLIFKLKWQHYWLQFFTLPSVYMLCQVTYNSSTPLGRVHVLSRGLWTWSCELPWSVIPRWQGQCALWGLMFFCCCSRTSVVSWKGWVLVGLLSWQDAGREMRDQWSRAAPVNLQTHEQNATEIPKLFMMQPMLTDTRANRDDKGILAPEYVI